MTTRRIVLNPSLPHVDMTCPCGGVVTAGHATETGHSFVLHSVPACEEFVRLPPVNFLVWARNHGGNALS